MLVPDQQLMYKNNRKLKKPDNMGKNYDRKPQTSLRATFPASDHIIPAA
jgi:hypothetical protein